MVHTSKLVTPLFAGLALLALTAPSASADPRGRELRTEEDCSKLPGTADHGERGRCITCVTRPVRHHYDLDFPQGKRCRADVGASAP
ncbi:MAG TPA: hypothetical protein VIF09_02205 [Polyangiaceae bacterium]|jgi:hypothetical protein